MSHTTPRTIDYPADDNKPLHPSVHEPRQPKLDLYDFFLGETKAWGLFEDRFGKVRRQFTVNINGRSESGQLVLTETFQYDDGEQDERIWHIEREGPDGYVGRAADVVGVARGQAFGNTLNWRYQLDLKIGAGSLRVKFEDWMFLQPGGVMINKAKLKKLGLTIGYVTIFFKKQKAPHVPLLLKAG